MLSSFLVRSSSGARSRLASRLSIPCCFSSEAAIVPGIGKGKTSTGYVGLAVEPNWKEAMEKHFGALLEKMEASDMPETAQYRMDVTKWCHYVLEQANLNPEDPEAVEDAVQMGQVEELIEMAQDEMVALDVYLKTRMWELVAETNPDIVFDPDPMQDPMAEDGNQDVQDELRKGMEDLQKK